MVSVSSQRKIKNQMFLIDEPTDAPRHCCMNTRDGQSDFVDYLLKNKAHVISHNGNTSFVVGDNYPVENHTYVLRKNHNQWRLQYYETPAGNHVRIDIEEIAGLQEWLREADRYKIEKEEIYKRSHELLKHFHEQWHLKTPLMLIGEINGFYSANQLYFTLLFHALDEAFIEPDKQTAFIYPVLKDFYVKFILPIKEHLEWYIREEMIERREGFHAYRVSILPNLHPERAKEVALILEVIAEGTSTLNYEEMIVRLAEITTNQASSFISRINPFGGSKLHEKLGELLREACEWKNKRIRQFIEACNQSQFLPGEKPLKEWNENTNTEMVKNEKKNSNQQSGDELLKMENEKITKEKEDLRKEKEDFGKERQAFEKEKEELILQINCGKIAEYDDEVESIDSPSTSPLIDNSVFSKIGVICQMVI